MPLSRDRKTPEWAAAFAEATAGFLSGKIRWHEPMADYTTYRIGGPAEALVFPESSSEIARLLQVLRRLDVPSLLLGRGSNVLVADSGVRGVVIVLGRSFGAIEIVGQTAAGVLIRVEAGCALARLVNWTVEQGLAGLEFAVGIPGSVGGAIVMNAGAWQQEMRDVLEQVTLMDGCGAVAVRPVTQMAFSYRSWGEASDRIALEGRFLLAPDDKEEIRRRCLANLAKRRARQPRMAASCGSFFKNPGGGRTAGQLIDQAGLKGVRVGGAMVSPVHANFLVNCGGATASDILNLMKVVQDRVAETFGVLLEPEVRFVGIKSRTGHDLPGPPRQNITRT